MTNKLVNFESDLELYMKKCINNFKININKIHVGRISPDILNCVTVEYYGSVTPLSQITNVVVEPPRTLIITVFDFNMVKSIERSILTSNLELIPVVSNNVIRITLPALTEDRRYTLIKMIRVEAEKSKISIRSIRRSANDKLKIFLRNKEINKDDEYHFENIIQNLTNIWIKEINTILKKKELEIMTF